MEAGITDHVWTIEEMLDKVSFETEKARFAVGPFLNPKLLGAHPDGSMGVRQIQAPCFI